MATFVQETETKEKPVTSICRKESDPLPGQFSDPVYKRLSRCMGEINKMSKEELKAKLEVHKLDNRGVKEVLKKRLKNYYKRQKLVKAKIKPPIDEPNFDYLFVIDFEATCQEKNHIGFKHEIIEFPVVVINTHTRTVEKEFHSYVKPQLNPQLTDFCINLTGITQKQVDESEPFPAVLQEFEDWLAHHEFGKKGKKFAVATDGPWDMGRFMYTQCYLSNLPFPKWAKKWVNIRKAYSNFYSTKRCKITVMLENIGLDFEGNLHSGIDDARNIARIALHLMMDGYDFQLNERLIANKYTPDFEVNAHDIATVERGTADSDSEDGSGDCNGHAYNSDQKNPEGGASETTMEASMNALSIDSAGSTEDNMEDLIAYYHSQKSYATKVQRKN